MLRISLGAPYSHHAFIRNRLNPNWPDIGTDRYRESIFACVIFVRDLPWYYQLCWCFILVLLRRHNLARVFCFSTKIVHRLDPDAEGSCPRASISVEAFRGFWFHLSNIGCDYGWRLLQDYNVVKKQKESRKTILNKCSHQRKFCSDLSQSTWLATECNDSISVANIKHLITGHLRYDSIFSV